MARTDHLPIDKTTYDLTSLTLKITKEFPRNLRELKVRIVNRSFDLAELIDIANSAEDKVPHLSDLLLSARTLERQFRLARDHRAISIPQHAEAIKVTQSVIRQATGWRKYEQSPAARRSRPSGPRDFSSGRAATGEVRE